MKVPPRMPPRKGVPPGRRPGQVPIVGPTPDYARAYVPPKTVPPPTDHRTIEIATVRLAPEIDPRCMVTQRSFPRMRPRSDAGRLPSGRPSVRPVTLRSGGPRRPRAAAISRPVWALLGVAVALAVVVGVRLFVQRIPNASPIRAGRLPESVREHTAGEAVKAAPLPTVAAERQSAAGASAAVRPQRVAAVPPEVPPHESLAVRSAPTAHFRGDSTAKQRAAVGPTPTGTAAGSLRPRQFPAVSSAGVASPNRDALGRPAGSAQQPPRASARADSPNRSEAVAQPTASPPPPRSRRPSFF